MKRCAIFLAAWWLVFASHAVATTITYQGQLKQSGAPFTGTADLEFRLYSNLSECCQQGPVETHADWPVEDGLFQVELDFGDVFSGERWLEVRVDGTILEPRQRVTAAPLAVRALGPWQSAGASGIAYDDAGVGIGTAPNSSNRLLVRAAHGAQNPLNVADDGGTTRLRVAANGGVAAGTNQLPPAGGLRVGTQLGIATAARQQLSVGSGLDLYSGAPADPSVPSIRGRALTENLVLNAAGGGAVFLNFDSGSGGVRFHDGSGGGGELMRLTGDGRLGIGVSDPDVSLDVAGFIRGSEIQASFFRLLLYGAGTGDQSLCRNSTQGYLTSCSSSRRYKHDIEALDYGLRELGALRPVRFRWIDGDRHDLGLIAEEVAEVLPELATRDADGVIEGVRYDHLTAVLVSAVQELAAENELLRGELERLRAHDLRALETRLSRLEADARP